MIFEKLSIRSGFKMRLDLNLKLSMGSFEE